MEKFTTDKNCGIYEKKIVKLESEHFEDRTKVISCNPKALIIEVYGSDLSSRFSSPILESSPLSFFQDSNKEQPAVLLLTKSKKNLTDQIDLEGPGPVTIDFGEIDIGGSDFTVSCEKLCTRLVEINGVFHS